MSTSLFLSLNGIAGEAKEDQFAGQIELLSASFSGNSEVITQGGSGASVGKVSLGPMLVTKNYDAASQSLFLKMCTGAMIGNGTISIVLNGVGPFVTINLTGVLIAGMTTSAASGALTDSVSLHYQTIQISYRSQNADGSLAAPIVTGWDLLRTTAISAPAVPPPIATTINKIPIGVLKR
jgi:type VI protein secretion system component Hcp